MELMSARARRRIRRELQKQQAGNQTHAALTGEGDGENLSGEISKEEASEDAERGEVGVTVVVGEEAFGQTSEEAGGQSSSPDEVSSDDVEASSIPPAQKRVRFDEAGILDDQVTYRQPRAAPRLCPPRLFPPCT